MGLTRSQGLVIWVTGLAGSGKSTVAKLLVEDLGSDTAAVLLDGDAIRSALGKSDCGFDLGSRLTIAQRICDMALMSAKQNPLTIVSTISLFHRIHKWNRRHLQQYRELLVNVSIEVLTKRDPHGLYSAYQSGSLTNVVGLDLVGEFPENPHWVVDNGGDRSQLVATCAVIARQVRHDLLRSGKKGLS